MEAGSVVTALLLLVLTLAIVGAPAVAGATPLRVTVVGDGGATQTGDHVSVTAVVTNTGPTAQRDVVVMLSLIDVTHSPATPQGLEDWTPAPEAARMARLAPGETFQGTWRLRLIQAGRLAAYATVVTGGDHTVTNSPPLLLEIAPPHNLTAATVWPIAVGGPLVTSLAVAWLFGLRRARVRVPSLLLGVATLLQLLSVPPDAGATPVSKTPPAEGVQIALSSSDTPQQTGDHLAVTAIVTNSTAERLAGATLVFGMADMTPGHPVPIGPESWTMDPESVAVPALPPGAAASATWHLVMIQPGPIGVFASIIASPSGPILSSPLVVFPIRERRVLNPGHVLPVALGVPLALLALLAIIRRARGARE